MGGDLCGAVRYVTGKPPDLAVPHQPKRHVFVAAVPSRVRREGSVLLKALNRVSKARTPAALVVSSRSLSVWLTALVAVSGNKAPCTGQKAQAAAPKRLN